MGVLVTFALLVELAMFLADAERRREAGSRPLARHARVLGEVLVDGALVAASFYAAYVIVIEGNGTVWERTCLRGLAARSCSRHATSACSPSVSTVRRRPRAGLREALLVVVSVAASSLVAYVAVRWWVELGEFPRRVFAVDAVLCAVLLVAGRFGERALVAADPDRPLAARCAPEPDQGARPVTAIAAPVTPAARWERLLAGDPTRGPLLRRRSPVRLAGLATPDALALQRRDRVHADRAVDRGDRVSPRDGASRSGAQAPTRGCRRRSGGSRTLPPSYEAIKTAQALVMSLVVVPAYLLARTMVERSVGAARRGRSGGHAGVRRTRRC